MTTIEHKSIKTVTAEDFETRYDADHTFPFFEDEDGSGVYGYGHADEAEFARQVNEYDRLAEGEEYDEEGALTADDVMHTYAVVYQPEGEADDADWMFTRTDVTAETPGAFPMTWVSR